MPSLRLRSFPGKKIFTRRRLAVVVLLLILLAAMAGAFIVWAAQSSTTAHPFDASRLAPVDDKLIAQGRYVAIAANCAPCHTAPGGKPFAGGAEFQTDFGKLFSPNITPDRETGIGGWSEREFVAALRQGLGRDGTHLYPAFPYTAYTQMSDADAHALFAYLRTIAPVSQPAKPHALDFPFNQRALLGVWKKLNFDEGRFRRDPEKSGQWNRGAYLTDALGHCSACHTPRGMLGGEITSQYMTGGLIRDRAGGHWLDWSTSNLTQADGGLGSWSAKDIADYLKYGRSERAAVFGPMVEVVGQSTKHLDLDDVNAMAVYLKSLPANAQTGGGGADSSAMGRGQTLYDIHCGICHQPDGKGGHKSAPSLVGSAIVMAPDPSSLINTALYGPHLGPDAKPLEWAAQGGWRQKMKGFDDKMGDEEMASLLTYVRNAWGHSASKVTEDQVAKQRIEY